MLHTGIVNINGEGREEVILKQYSTTGALLFRENAGWVITEEVFDEVFLTEKEKALVKGRRGWWINVNRISDIKPYKSNIIYLGGE